MYIGHPERCIEWCRAQLARGRDTHTLTRAALVIALKIADSEAGYEPIDPDEETIEFRLAALPLWKKRQMMANIHQYVDADFRGEGGLSQTDEAE
jgi:hypothetical protein